MPDAGNPQRALSARGQRRTALAGTWVAAGPHNRTHELLPAARRQLAGHAGGLVSVGMPTTDFPADVSVQNACNFNRRKV
jgi:hypothetical protein